MTETFLFEMCLISRCVSLIRQGTTPFILYILFSLKDGDPYLVLIEGGRRWNKESRRKTKKERIRISTKRNIKVGVRLRQVIWVGDQLKANPTYLVLKVLTQSQVDLVVRWLVRIIGIIDNDNVLHQKLSGYTILRLSLNLNQDLAKLKML